LFVHRYRSEREHIKGKGTIPWWMTVALMAILIPLLHSHVRAQDPNTVIDLLTATGRGYITLELLVYDTGSLAPDDPVDDPQTYATFRDCNALAVGDLALFPPWGDFPYGLWHSTITLSQDFDPNVHRIVMKIYFPGQINPLNAQYWTQEYDVEEKEIEWREFERSLGLFVPDIDEQSVTIRLEDSRPSAIEGEILSGLGDRDPNKGVIEHVGGLLWPIPAGGRCFIENARPGHRNTPSATYHTSAKEGPGIRPWTSPTTSSGR